MQTTLGFSRRAILPPVQPDAWWAMMETTVVATFLAYRPNPTSLADSDAYSVYANQALAKITARTALNLEN
jgi:hypothetical protein